MPIDATQPYDDSNIFARSFAGSCRAARSMKTGMCSPSTTSTRSVPTHILVIPKGPYVSWDDFSAKASDEEIAALVRAVGKIAREAGLVEDGYRLLANTGREAGQEVPHLHVHIFAGRPLGPMLAR